MFRGLGVSVFRVEGVQGLGFRVFRVLGISGLRCSGVEDLRVKGVGV